MIIFVASINQASISRVDAAAGIIWDIDTNKFNMLPVYISIRIHWHASITPVTISNYIARLLDFFKRARVPINQEYKAYSSWYL